MESGCTFPAVAGIAAHLVDEVLGGLPVRQWVLTTPHRLRYALVYDQRLVVERNGADGARIEIVGRGWEESAGTDAELNRRVEVQWFTLE